MPKKKEKNMRWPGVEPGSTAWKAAMLTVTPPTQARMSLKNNGVINLLTSQGILADLERGACPR